MICIIITKTHKGDFYCLNCLNSLRIESKLKSHDKYVIIKIFVRAYFLRIINIDNLGFDHIKDKNTLYRGKDCMKKFCESLREHATKKQLVLKKSVPLKTNS